MIERALNACFRRKTSKRFMLMILAVEWATLALGSLLMIILHR